MRRVQIFALVTIALLSSKAIAQAPPTESSSIPRRDHITLAAGLMLKEPAQATPTDGFSLSDPHYGGAWASGLRFGVIYTFHLGRRFGFESGFIPSIYRDGVRYNFSPNRLFQSNQWHPNTCLEIPMRLFTRLRIKKSFWIQPSLGVSAVVYGRKNILFTTSFADSLGQSQFQGYADIEVSGEQSILWNWQAGTAFSLELPNQDLIRLGLTANLVMDGENFKSSWGKYVIVDGTGSLVGKGFVDSRGSFLSVDVGYTFSRSRRAAKEK